jgi:ATP-binding cassette, subfamily B, bacterial
VPGPRRHARAIGAAIALQWQVAPAPAAAIAALTGATAGTSALAAWLTKQLLDAIAAGDAHRAVRFAALGGAIGGLTLCATHAAQILSATIRRRVVLHVERALFRKVNELDGLRQFEDPAFHDRLRLAEQAARDAPHQVGDLALAVIRTVVSIGALLGVVIAVSPVIAALLLVSGALALAARIARSRSDLATLDALAPTQRWRDAYRALLVDVKAAKEIRLFGLGELLLGRMIGALDRAMARETAVEQRGAALQIGLALVGAAVTAIGAAVVASGAVAGRFGVGDVALFLAAVAGIQAAFGGLLNQIGAIGRLLHLFHNYRDVLAIDVPAGGTAAAPALARAVELRDVWFRYDAGQPWILRGVDLVIPRGKAVGLVGLNGAGKSTLVKLLCGFYQPCRGRILWDGVDVRTLDRRALAQRMAVVFQDFMTYDLTAGDNIGLGDLRYLDDEPRLRAAAAAAGIDAAIAALPSGYRTLLSRVLAAPGDGPAPAGVTLSGGQWQRVAVARALLRDTADLVILDEPSAGLDAEAEHALHRALAGHAAGRSRLLISHRLGSLRDADTIAVLAGGVISELGTHDELIACGRDYARLFRLQASAYQDRTSIRAELDDELRDARNVRTGGTR